MEKNQEYGVVSLFRSIDTVKKHWVGFLILGILLIVFGLVAMGASVFTTAFSVILFGFLLAAFGIAQIIHAFWASKWTGILLSIFLGVLYLVTGVLCIIHPLASAVSLTLLIGAFCLFGGIFRIITSLILRFDQWGWVCFNGVVTLLLGILILADWPVSGLWVIGLFVGIDMLLSGWSWVLLALSARPKTRH